MTSIKQIEANKRNALRSTGPTSSEGKLRSRCNAVRHGLTAETVISGLEDADDYRAFEAAVTADFDVETAVERELVLRLASLLWRLRRAVAIETSLFDYEARHGRNTSISANQAETLSNEPPLSRDGFASTTQQQHNSEFARAFMQMMSSPHFPLDRLSRYEGNLWRQASHALYLLAPKRHRKRARTSNVFGIVQDQS